MQLIKTIVMYDVGFIFSYISFFRVLHWNRSQFSQLYMGGHAVLSALSMQRIGTAHWRGSFI